MKLNGYRCDACCEEYLLGPSFSIDQYYCQGLPSDWFVISRGDPKESETPITLCSPKCLFDYAQKISGAPQATKEQYALYPDVSVPSPTKMRRFLLISEEKDVEGVKWSNGCVSIDPEGEYDLFYRSWAQFKEAFDGSGIQWIDQEVSGAD